MTQGLGACPPQEPREGTGDVSPSQRHSLDKGQGEVTGSGTAEGWRLRSTCRAESPSPCRPEPPQGLPAHPTAWDSEN